MLQTGNLELELQKFPVRSTSAIFERRKLRAQIQINHECFLFWDVSKHIGSVLFGGERAQYGRRIVATLS